MKKSTDAVDKHVGARIRMRRMIVGLSQDRLGKSLDVSFQQVQKYEKGHSKIGASQLSQMAKALGVPVDYFFQGTPVSLHESVGFQDTTSGKYVAEFLATNEGVQLNQAFQKIKNQKVRRKLIDLMNSLASE